MSLPRWPSDIQINTISTIRYKWVDLIVFQSSRYLIWVLFPMLLWDISLSCTEAGCICQTLILQTSISDFINKLMSIYVDIIVRTYCINKLKYALEILKLIYILHKFIVISLGTPVFWFGISRQPTRSAKYLLIVSH